MNAFLNTLGGVAPMFIVLGLGAWFRHRRIMTSEADSTLVNLLMQVLFPCFIFSRLTSGKLEITLATALAAIGIGLALVCLGFLLCYLAARPLAGLRKSDSRRAFALTTGIHNYGYAAIPLADAIYPDSGVTGIILICNLGVEIGLWSVGIMLACGGWQADSWKRMLNFPMLAIIGSTTAALCGLGSHVPSLVGETAKFLGACSIPLGVLVSGASLYSSACDVGSPMRNLRVPAAAMVMRLGILPLGFLAVALIPGLDPLLAKALVIHGAMPSAVFPIVLCRHYRGDTGVGLQAIASTTIFSIITLPLWIHLGQRLLER